MNLLKVSFALLACMGIASAAPPLRQSDASWVAAFSNGSTSPSYAMFTVVDGNTGTARRTCTEANFLLGALITENEWGTDREAQLSALHVVLTDERRVFTFTRRKALDNLQRSFSDDELARTRVALRDLSTRQVLAAAGMHANGAGPLDAIFEGRGASRYAAEIDAVACVLMERGESPGIQDITGQLFVERGFSPVQQRASSSP